MKLNLEVTETDTTIEYDFNDRVIEVVVMFGKAGEHLDVTIATDPRASSWSKGDLISALLTAVDRIYEGDLG